MVGAAIARKLERERYRVIVRTRSELDLLNQAAVRAFFIHNGIDAVVLAAARVGGIEANRTEQADFLYENVTISANVIHAAHLANIPRLLFLGSSCIYPKDAENPIKESALMTGALESTNEGYALAKIVGVKLCEMYHRQYGRSYVSAMPCNLYGPGDNWHPERSHVIPGIVGRILEAKRTGAPFVTLWGSGKPRREFLYVDDLADALFLVLKKYGEPTPINIGSGQDISIHKLAHLIKDVCGYSGEIRFDPSRPDGVARKCLDVSRIAALGWRPRIALRQGLEALTQY